MKYITTANYRSDGKLKLKVLVDDNDFELISKYHWHASKDKSVKATINGKKILLHRFLMDCPRHLEVDHIDGNRLNNMRSNLRLATSSQNKMNRGARKDCKSGYKGVSFHKPLNKWTARIMINDKYKHLGVYEDIMDAVKAYNHNALKYHGEFAKLNII
jgi:hypothetical protein